MRSLIGILLLMLIFSSSASSSQGEQVYIEVAHAFSVQAPSGTKVVPNTGGSDSLSGRIMGPDFTLHYDYGFYSNPLDDRASEPGFRARVLDINGRQAKLIMHDLAGDANRFIGIHFPEFKRTSAGAVRLTLTCTLDHDEKIRAEVEKVYRSIRILEPPPESDETAARNASQVSRN